MQGKVQAIEADHNRQLLEIQRMIGKPMEYSGELYSDEHKRRFKANDVTAQVGRLEGKLMLAINGANIGEWFKEQFERLRENIGWKPMQKTNRGFKL